MCLGSPYFNISFDIFYATSAYAKIIYPEIDDLIFYTEITPKEIVESAINYKPIQL